MGPYLIEDHVARNNRGPNLLLQRTQELDRDSYWKRWTQHYNVRSRRLKRNRWRPLGCTEVAGEWWKMFGRTMNRPWRTCKRLMGHKNIYMYIYIHIIWTEFDRKSPKDGYNWGSFFHVQNLSIIGYMTVSAWPLLTTTNPPCMLRTYQREVSNKHIVNSLISYGPMGIPHLSYLELRHLL